MTRWDAPPKGNIVAKFSESSVEDAALACFETLGYAVCGGLTIAPGGLAAERTAYGETILARRLGDALVRLNPQRSLEALDHQVWKAAAPQAPSMFANDRAFHRELAERTPVGSWDRVSGRAPT